MKKAGDTMSGKLTISYGGLSVDGSADISGDLNTGRLQVGKPDDHRDTHLYGNLYLNDMLNMSIGSNVALKFANLQDGLKLYAPLSFEPSPLRISNVGNPQNDFDAVNKITLDSKVTGINAELTDVNNQIATLTTRMGTAEKNITKNTSDITSLTNRVTTNETSINNINTEITNIKQDITTVEGDYVKKAGDTMSGKLTISYGGLSVDGSADISGDLNTGRLQVGKPDDHRDTHLYGNLYLNDMLNMSIGSNVALKFANLQDGLKLYAPLSFEPSPLRISNVGNPQNDFDAVNKITLDSKVTGINAELTDVNNQIATLTTRMGTAEKNITKNTSDITSLTNRVTTNETSINNINTEITNIKQDITTVEGDYVKKAGDTMTGNLTMGLNQIVMDTGHIVAGNNTLLFEGYPLIDVNGAKISMIADPVEGMDAANKEYVDKAVAEVKPSAGTTSGDINMGVNNSVRFGTANYALYQNKDTGHLVLTGNSNTDIVEMNNIGTLQFGNKTTIQNVKTPTNIGDATPKSYVDDQISIAKNDVYEQIHNYLPLTGGTLTGAVRFGTTASIGELVDFGLVAKMDSGNLGIVTQSIIHTNDSTSTDGVTYTLANLDSDIHYTCAGNGVKQMNIGSFETVKVSSSLLVAEDPTQNMQVATKRYVDQHAGGGGEYVPLSNNLCCYISEIGGGVYKCDCYLLEQFNMKGTISANEDSFAKSINHNLNDYLETNNYSVIGKSLDTFIFMGAGGGHTIITCTGHLYSTSLTIKIITTTFESEDKTIDQNINAGKVGSMLLRKNR